MHSTTLTAPEFDRAHIAAHARAIVRLGAPILVNNLSVTAMAFADTVMAGQLGARDLAGLAVGLGYFNLFLFVGLGLFMSLSPAIAHAYGADDAKAVTRYVRQSWWLLLGLTLLLFAGARQASWVLPAMNISADILPIAIGYVDAMSWGLPGLLGFFALRFASEGLGHTRPIMFIAFGCLLLNIFGNWVFMYGRFGMPELRAIGCGVATAIGYWAMCLSMLVYVSRHRFYRRFEFFREFSKPDFQVIGELLRLGLPVAGSVLAEGGLFAAAALLMGVMGAVTTSAHQIALNYAAFMFMIPLAVSSATTIHVGHLRGAGSLQARQGAATGVGMCVGIMTISALCIVALNDRIAGLYTKDPDVRRLAAMLLLFGAVFQVSDGLQVGLAGALRGFKDTAVPMTMCLFSYWVVGFPLAYVLGVRHGLGPTYVWGALIAGLTVCAGLLLIRFQIVSRR
jgi:MATE family multidrug resistance protein